MWWQLHRGSHNQIGPKRKCHKGPEKKDTHAWRSKDKDEADFSLDAMREEQHLITEGKCSQPSILCPEKVLLKREGAFRPGTQKGFSSADQHRGSTEESGFGWKQVMPEQIGANTEERRGSGMATAWKHRRHFLINFHLFKTAVWMKVVTMHFGVSDICVSGRYETIA